jgi:hypothetical protein
MSSVIFSLFRHYILFYLCGFIFFGQKKARPCDVALTRGFPKLAKLLAVEGEDPVLMQEQPGAAQVVAPAAAAEGPAAPVVAPVILVVASAAEAGKAAVVVPKQHQQPGQLFQWDPQLIAQFHAEKHAQQQKLEAAKMAALLLQKAPAAVDAAAEHKASEDEAASAAVASIIKTGNVALIKMIFKSSSELLDSNLRDLVIFSIFLQLLNSA